MKVSKRGEYALRALIDLGIAAESRARCQIDSHALSRSDVGRAVDAIAAGRSYRVIPWPMGVVAKALRLLPNAWYDRLLAGRGRKPRRG